MAEHAKKQKPQAIVFKILIVLGSLFILFCLFMIGRELFGYYQASSVYNELAKVAYTNTVDPNPQGGAIDAPLSRSIDFATLNGINPDIVGWIAQEGTVIDYPVVHGADNDQYMHRLVDNTYSELGTIFMEADNKADYTDQNTILYGHHAIDGSMFTSICEYKDPAYYEAHPTMTLYTPGGTYLVQLFAGYIGDANVEFMQFRTTNFATGQDFMNYIQAARENSTFDSPVTVSETDHILSLCTCTYEFDNARYILHGKLVKVS